MSMRLGKSTSFSPGGHVVVTGAAGFIGSHLVDALLKRGETVVGIDSFDPWYDVGQRQSNLANACRSRRFVLHSVDLLRANLALIFDGASVLYHLAARPGVQDSWAGGFANTTQQNILGTQVVLEAALATQVGRVVCASSSSIYGETARAGGSRSTRPVSPYGVSKAATEQLALVYGDLGLAIACPRYFTVYGPRQRPDMAMHKMFEATRPNGPTFERRGSGQQTREFTYVGDVVTATLAAASAPGAAGAAFDIGGGSSISVNAVAEMVGVISGREVQTADVPLPAGDPPATVADGVLAKQLLGWAPETSLRQGLEEQSRWHARRAICAARATALAG